MAELSGTRALRAGSPALRAGAALPRHPKLDFAGRPLSNVDDRIDLGAITRAK